MSKISILNYNPINYGKSKTLLVYSFIVFLFFAAVQAIFMGYGFRPDEWKAVDYFSQAIFNDNYKQEYELYIRFLIGSACLIMVMVLYKLKLISTNVLIFAFVWPMTPFLFSKIYWEFFIFPFALISVNKRVNFDIFVSAMLLLLLAVTGEQNIAVLIVFRLMLIAVKLGLGWIVPCGYLLLCFAVSFLMDVGVMSGLPVVGGWFARFDWTRTIANPEYSIFETLIVFFTSMHYFTMHSFYWGIDFVFSLIVILTLFLYRKDKKEIQNNILYASIILSIVIGTSMVTYAFQNARYYYFFIAVIPLFVKVGAAYPLSFIGFAHVGLKLIEVQVFSS